MIGQQLSHYEILEKLGAGGMGVVYKARDTKLNRDVSLKFLPDHSSVDEEYHSRFLQEARSIAQLNHVNICQIYSIEDDHDGNQFIVMEYIDGANLHDSFIGDLKNKNGVSPESSGSSSLYHENPHPRRSERALDYALQIAKGLEAAHEKGIIHRDIKPANIMVTKSGIIKILDFGLAKIAGVDHDQLTKAGSTIGTISYMSPEQIRGEELDARSDIWSFGVVMYEMLTGRSPFAGDYEHSIMYSIINSDPLPIVSTDGNIPDGLEQIIYRCISKEPASRYQSSTELLNDLTKPGRLSQTGIPVPGEQFKVRISIPEAKKKRVLLYALGILASASVFAYLFVTGSQILQNRILPVDAEYIHLAVLPFTNIGADPSRQVFADGLVETITSQLTQLERFQDDLWVVPAGEMRNLNILSAGDAYQMFGVNYAIAGSIQPISDRLRLTISLIDSENLRQLNSSVIDVGATDVLELHDKSVESLLAMLNLELNPETIGVIREGKTSVPAAFELYIQGLGYLQRYERVENINNAILAFEEAVELDPQFALAFAGLGQAYWRIFENTRDRAWLELASEQCKIASGLNNQLLQVNITLGMISTGTGRYEQAIGHFNDALATDPTNADAYRGLAEAYEYAGNFEEAELTYKRAIQLKPDYWAGYNVLGTFYFRNSKYEEAKEQFQRVIDLTPDNYRGYMNLGSMHYFTEQYDEARTMYEQSFALEETYSVASNLGTLYYTEGKYSESAGMYEAALNINDGNYLLWGNLASAYYWAPGKRNQAFPVYERAKELALEQYDINPNDPELVVSLAGYEAMFGNEQQARAYIRDATGLAPDNTTVMYLSGTAFETLGDRNEALAWIGKAIHAGYSLSEIRNQPELKDLTADPRFEEILQDAGY